MIGKKIKERREELGLSQEQLAKMIGVTKSAVSNYEINISSPKEKVLFKLFDALKCDANFLYEDYLEFERDFKFTVNEKKHIKKYRTLDKYGKDIVDTVLDKECVRCASESEKKEIPTITIQHSLHKVSAGHGFDLNNEDEWEEIEVPDTPEARRADFSLTISGDSMEPIYSDGDIVLVKSQPTVDIGETGIFVVNGSGYIKQNGGDRLISLNPNYDDIFFSEGDTVSCAGKVIGVV